MRSFFFLCGEMGWSGRAGGRSWFLSFLFFLSLSIFLALLDSVRVCSAIQQKEIFTILFFIFFVGANKGQNSDRQYSLIGPLIDCITCM